MTNPERTEELVRAMLERRAGGSAPDWLLDDTMQRIATSRQSRRRRSRLASAGDPRLLLIAVVALALLALTSVLAAGALLQRDANPLDPEAAIIVAPFASATPTDGPAPSTSGEPADVTPPVATPRATPTATPTATPEEPSHSEHPDGIDIETDGPAINALARVTPAGDGLRVRNAPGLGADSLPLKPLLPAGADVFVTDGPVHADGYDWYQVLADTFDRRLFGWVASGTDLDTWVATVPLECPGTPTVDDAIARPPTEYLTCFGDQSVTVTGQINDGLGPFAEGQTEEDFVCPDLISAEGCDLNEGWLQIPVGGVYFPVRDVGALSVALPPEVEARFHDAPLGRDVKFTIAMDAPEAGDCRVVDSESGQDHVPRDAAITRCRLTFVLRDIDW